MKQPLAVQAITDLKSLRAVVTLLKSDSDPRAPVIWVSATTLDQIFEDCGRVKPLNMGSISPDGGVIYLVAGAFIGVKR